MFRVRDMTEQHICSLNNSICCFSGTDVNTIGKYKSQLYVWFVVQITWTSSLALWAGSHCQFGVLFLLWCYEPLLAEGLQTQTANLLRIIKWQMTWLDFWCNKRETSCASLRDSACYSSRTSSLPWICWSHVSQSGLLCKCRVFENSWGPHLRYGLLLIIGGVVWCGVRLTDACSSWYRGGLSPGWNTGPHTPPLCWPPSPCLMSHELPVCLLLPAVSALPLPGQSLKHMLLCSAEQPDRQTQPNCYKEQSCHFLFPPFFLLGCSSKRGMGCSVIKLPFQMLCLT